MGVDVAHLVRIAKPDISYLVVHRTIGDEIALDCFSVIPRPPLFGVGGLLLNHSHFGTSML